MKKGRRTVLPNIHKDKSFDQGTAWSAVLSVLMQHVQGFVHKSLYLCHPLFALAADTGYKCTSYRSRKGQYTIHEVSLPGQNSIAQKEGQGEHRSYKKMHSKKVILFHIFFLLLVLVCHDFFLLVHAHLAACSFEGWFQPFDKNKSSFPDMPAAWARCHSYLSILSMALSDTFSFKAVHEHSMFLFRN